MSYPLLDRSLAGRRVRLVSTSDPFTDLRPGAIGTIQYTVVDSGTIAVRWESGSTLGLLPGVDRWVEL